jgi:hypothetical protein
MSALSQPSVLYDYYNPESQAVVEPVLFNVEDHEENARGWTIAAQLGASAVQPRQ